MNISRSLKILPIFLAATSIFLSGCLSGKKMTPQKELLYSQALNCVQNIRDVKNAPVACVLSVVPGLGIYYATDSLGDGISYFFASLLGVPYLTSFYESAQVCEWRNKQNVIDIYICKPCAVADKKAEWEQQVQQGVVTQQQLEINLQALMLEQAKRCSLDVKTR